MLKRLLENLKWLFNHPPTNITADDPENIPPCDYCGITKPPRWHVRGEYCICEHCRKKVFDSVLKPRSDELEIPGEVERILAADPDVIQRWYDQNKKNKKK